MFRDLHPSSCERRLVREATPVDDGAWIRSEGGLRRRLRWGRDLTVCYLRTIVSAVAFWVAVAIPFLSLALVLRGLETRNELVAFVALLVVNVLALRLGHSYRHPEPDRAR